MSNTPSPRLRGPPTPRLGFQRSDSARISIGRGRSRNSLKTPSPRPGSRTPSQSRTSAPPSPCPGPASPAAVRARASRGGRGRPVSLPSNTSNGVKKVTTEWKYPVPTTYMYHVLPSPITKHRTDPHTPGDDTISEGCNRKHQLCWQLVMAAVGSVGSCQLP